MVDLIKAPIQTDSDGFLSRECPFCHKLFKIKPEIGEVKSDDEEPAEQNENEDTEVNAEPVEQCCPYCGQKASGESWLTQEQKNYTRVYVENLAAKIFNDFSADLESQFRGNKYVSFKANSVPQEEPWISPEPNDMRIFDLPCCKRPIKVEDDYKGTIFCPYCGFPHEQKS